MRAGRSRMTRPAAAGSIRCNPRLRRQVGGIRLYGRRSEAMTGMQGICSAGLVGAPQSHIERATVRVEERPVDRGGEPAMPGGQLAALTDEVAAQSPGRSGSAAAAVMPRVELGGALADGVRGPSGVEQVIVLVLQVEVFALQRETQLTGEAAGSVPHRMQS